MSIYYLLFYHYSSFSLFRLKLQNKNDSKCNIDIDVDKSCNNSIYGLLGVFYCRCPNVYLKLVDTVKGGYNYLKTIYENNMYRNLIDLRITNRTVIDQTVEEHRLGI